MRDQAPELPIIVQHSFGVLGSGGPIGALTRVLNSDLAQQFDFHHVAQTRPARGVNIPLIWSMAREMRNARAQLAHIRGLGNEGFHGVVAARLARIPHVLVSVHGSQRDLVHSAGGKIRPFIVGRLLEPLTLRLADAVVAVCEQGLDRPEIRRVSRKIRGVVPNGVELPSLTDRRSAAIRTELGIGVDEVAVVIVARVVRDKGHFELIEALAELELDARRPRMHLLVVGDGPDLPAVRAAGANLSATTVHLLGMRDDVGEVLSGSDIFAMPSYHEGMSNALLEAMAHGLPVVTTSVGGSTEVVSKGGGTLVAAQSVDELARALADMIDDPRSRVRSGAAARGVIERNYTTGHMTRALRGVYEAILAGGGR